MCLVSLLIASSSILFLLKPLAAFVDLSHIFFLAPVHLSINVSPWSSKYSPSSSIASVPSCNVYFIFLLIFCSSVILRPSFLLLYNTIFLCSHCVFIIKNNWLIKSDIHLRSDDLDSCSLYYCLCITWNSSVSNS